MRIDQIAGLAPGGADRGRGFGLVGAAGVELFRISASVLSGSTKRPDCLSCAIRRRTPAASRPLASNNSRSKFDDTWISIEGDAEACTSRTS